MAALHCTPGSPLWLVCGMYDDFQFALEHHNGDAATAARFLEHHLYSGEPADAELPDGALESILGQNAIDLDMASDDDAPILDADDGSADALDDAAAAAAAEAPEEELITDFTFEGSKLAPSDLAQLSKGRAEAHEADEPAASAVHSSLHTPELGYVEQDKAPAWDTSNHAAAGISKISQTGSVSKKHFADVVRDVTVVALQEYAQRDSDAPLDEDFVDANDQTGWDFDAPAAHGQAEEGLDWIEHGASVHDPHAHEGADWIDEMSDIPLAHTNAQSNKAGTVDFADMWAAADQELHAELAADEIDELPTDWTLKLLPGKGSIGTDATVSVELFGKRGKSGVIDLPRSQNRLNGKSETVNFRTVPVGELLRIGIGHDNSGRSPAWYLQELTLIRDVDERRWHFTVAQHFDKKKGDKKTWRECVPDSVSSSSMKPTPFKPPASPSMPSSVVTPAHALQYDADTDASAIDMVDAPPDRRPQLGAQPDRQRMASPGSPLDLDSLVALEAAAAHAAAAKHHEDAMEAKAAGHHRPLHQAQPPDRDRMPPVDSAFAEPRLGEPSLNERFPWASASVIEDASARAGLSPPPTGLPATVAATAYAALLPCWMRLSSEAQPPCVTLTVCCRALGRRDAQRRQP